MSQNRYLPFGEVRNINGVTNITETDFGYTGQRNLASIGLMDYDARFYSPTLMRFTQPDSIVANPFNPKSLNRFSYVMNSPIMFIDPTGHYCADGMTQIPGTNYCTDIPLPPPPTSPAPSSSDGGEYSSSSNSGKTIDSLAQSNFSSPDDLWYGCLDIYFAAPECQDFARLNNLANSIVERDTAILLDSFNGLCIPTTTSLIVCSMVIPPGSESSVHGSHEKAQGLHKTGLLLDFGEILFAAAQQELVAIGLGIIDLGVTIPACIIAGDCYYGSPADGIPPMVVVGQDVIVTGADVVGGTLGIFNVSLPGGVDLVTSGASAIYDSKRIYYGLETYITAGWTPITPNIIYMMMYPP